MIPTLKLQMQMQYVTEYYVQASNSRGGHWHSTIACREIVTVFSFLKSLCTTISMQSSPALPHSSLFKVIDAFGMTPKTWVHLIVFNSQSVEPGSWPENALQGKGERQEDKFSSCKCPHKRKGAYCTLCTNLK